MSIVTSLSTVFHYTIFPQNPREPRAKKDNFLAQRRYLDGYCRDYRYGSIVLLERYSDDRAYLSYL